MSITLMPNNKLLGRGAISKREWESHKPAVTWPLPDRYVTFIRKTNGGPFHQLVSPRIPAGILRLTKTNLNKNQIAQIRRKSIETAKFAISQLGFKVSRKEKASIVDAAECECSELIEYLTNEKVPLVIVGYLSVVSETQDFRAIVSDDKFFFAFDHAGGQYFISSQMTVGYKNPHGIEVAIFGSYDEFVESLEALSDRCI